VHRARWLHGWHRSSHWRLILRWDYPARVVPRTAVARRSLASATATPPGELVGIDDPAGQHRTTGPEPLTRDLQAEFVKPTERAQVRAHEGKGMRPSAIRGMSRFRHCLPSRLVPWASPPEFGEQLREGPALIVASSCGLQTR
jgi:hypothetical protein